MKTTYCSTCQSTVKVIHDFGINYSDVYYCAQCDTELNYNLEIWNQVNILKEL